MLRYKSVIHDMYRALLTHVMYFFLRPLFWQRVLLFSRLMSGLMYMRVYFWHIILKMSGQERESCLFCPLFRNVWPSHPTTRGALTILFLLRLHIFLAPFTSPAPPSNPVRIREECVMRQKKAAERGWRRSWECYPHPERLNIFSLFLLLLHILLAPFTSPAPPSHPARIREEWVMRQKIAAERGWRRSWESYPPPSAWTSLPSTLKSISFTTDLTPLVPYPPTTCSICRPHVRYYKAKATACVCYAR
jgi:hypothetical protein